MTLSLRLRILPKTGLQIDRTLEARTASLMSVIAKAAYSKFVRDFWCSAPDFQTFGLRFLGVG